MSKISVSVLFVMAICFCSCLKKKTFSDIPEIGYVSYTIGDSADPHLIPDKFKIITLKVSFQDGDGDIGLDQGDTMSGDFIATKNVLVNGQVVRSSDASARIPNLNSYAGKHGLSGYIEKTFSLFGNDGETVRYDIYIYDRAMHKSNVVHSPEILVK